MFVPSRYQSAVFDDVERGAGHTVVIARAGSGKTTTIVESLSRVPRGLSTLFVAFNAKIAEDLKKRAPWSADVSTLHSYGFAALRRAFGNVRLEKRKIDDMIRPRIEAPADRATMVRAVGLAKGALAETPMDIRRAIDAAELEVSAALAPVLLEGVRWCLEQSREDATIIDYDDMIWLPVVLGLSLKRYDRVFIDEVQDLNPAQIELALRACKEGGRICAVGDDRQAIYGFRGADDKAVANVVRRLSAKTLPLSVCYRCARTIVEVAREVVPDIEAAPGAIDGAVDYNATVRDLVEGVAGGDFVLSRVNAPLVSLFFMLVAAEVPAKVAGRDVGARLIERVKKAKAATVPKLLERVREWVTRERERLAKQDPPGDPATAEDIAECIEVVSNGAASVAEVEQRLADMFSDDLGDEAVVMLSSTHKAKGLERSPTPIGSARASQKRTSGTWRSRGRKRRSCWSPGCPAMTDDDDALRARRQADNAAAWDARIAPRGPSAPLPALPLLPRRAWVQADHSRPPQAPGGTLGRIAWEEHAFRWSKCRGAGSW